MLRLSGTIGNGLGNAGDRLSLVAASGRVLDAFSYGDDTTYVAARPIPAPGSGRSIERHFEAGAFRDAEIAAPSPGRLTDGTDAPTLDDVRVHLESVGLARQKWPEELHVVAELPRTASGKVQKFRLRQALREGTLT